MARKNRLGTKLAKSPYSTAGNHASAQVRLLDELIALERERLTVEHEALAVQKQVLEHVAYQSRWIAARERGRDED